MVSQNQRKIQTYNYLRIVPERKNEMYCKIKMSSSLYERSSQNNDNGIIYDFHVLRTKNKKNIQQRAVKTLERKLISDGLMKKNEILETYFCDEDHYYIISGPIFP